ncbi:MAG: hypothetical protein FJZ62_05055 [Chlamydiae bacterium]|nr:hypothetical protein [Chlamydiota bacterium]
MTQLTSAAIVASAEFLGKMQKMASDSTTIFKNLEITSIQQAQENSMKMADEVQLAGQLDAQITTQQAVGSGINAGAMFFSVGAEACSSALATRNSGTKDLQTLTELKQDREVELEQLGGGIPNQPTMTEFQEALVKSSGLDADQKILSPEKKYTLVQGGKLKEALNEDPNARQLKKIFNTLDSTQKESFLEATNKLLEKRSENTSSELNKISRHGDLFRNFTQHAIDAGRGAIQQGTQNEKASVDKQQSLFNNAQDGYNTTRQKQEAELQKTNDETRSAAEALINQINNFARG